MPGLQMYASGLHIPNSCEEHFSLSLAIHGGTRSKVTRLRQCRVIVAARCKETRCRQRRKIQESHGRASRRGKGDATLAAQPAVSLSNTHPREALYVLLARISLRAGLAIRCSTFRERAASPKIKTRQARSQHQAKPPSRTSSLKLSCTVEKTQGLLLALRQHLSRAGTWPAGTRKRGQVGVSSSNDEDPDELDVPSGKQVTLPRRTPSHHEEHRIEHHDAPRSDQRKDRRRRAPSASEASWCKNSHVRRQQLRRSSLWASPHAP